MDYQTKIHTDLTKPKKREKKPRKYIKRVSKKQAQYEQWLIHTARPAVIARDSLICQCCNRLPFEDERFDLDHIDGKGHNPSLKWDVNNLQFLDRDCHRRKTDHIKCLH